MVRLEQKAEFMTIDRRTIKSDADRDQPKWIMSSTVATCLFNIRHSYRIPRFEPDIQLPGYANYNLADHLDFLLARPVILHPLHMIPQLLHTVNSDKTRDYHLPCFHIV